MSSREEWQCWTEKYCSCRGQVLGHVGLDLYQVFLRLTAVFAGLSQTAWCSSNSVWLHSLWYRKGGRCLSSAPGCEALVWGLPYNSPGDLVEGRLPPSPSRDSACMCLCLKSAWSNPGQTHFPWIPESLKVLTHWKTRMIIKQGYIASHQKEIRR